MVLAVVEVNGLTTHDRLQGAELVWELLESDARGLCYVTAQVFPYQAVDHC